LAAKIELNTQTKPLRATVAEKGSIGARVVLQNPNIRASNHYFGQR
jgi:hypothetical protein